MEPSYKEVFENYIGNVVRNVSIISYDCRTGNSGKLYHPFSHGLDEEGSLKLGQALRNYLVFYAYDEKEVISRHLKGRLTDLERAASIALKKRIPDRHGDTNGLYGEALLDLVLQLIHENIKRASLRTVYRQADDNSEIKGFDSVHMSVKDDIKKLYFGQSKLGGKEYCISGIRSDFKKMTFLYTYDQLVFIADKTGYIPTEIKFELEKINDLLEDLEGSEETSRKQRLATFFQENNYRLVIPCLLAYESPSDIYNDIDRGIEKETQNIISRLDDSTIPIDFCEYEIMFVVFPVADVAKLREGMGLNV